MTAGHSPVHRHSTCKIPQPQSIGAKRKTQETAQEMPDNIKIQRQTQYKAASVGLSSISNLQSSPAIASTNNAASLKNSLLEIRDQSRIFLEKQEKELQALKETRLRYEELLENQWIPIDHLYANAKLHYDNHEFIQAKALLDAIILVYPTHYKCLNLRAHIWVYFQKPDEAIQDCFNAILAIQAAEESDVNTTLTSEYFDVYSMLSLAYHLKNDLVRSMEYTNLAKSYKFIDQHETEIVSPSRPNSPVN